jgi:hypothetical protein
VVGHPPPAVEANGETVTRVERDRADWVPIDPHGPGRALVSRLSVKKTYKLYIGGAFPRSESGRSFEFDGHNVARASRKDARDSVRAARAVFDSLPPATDK